MAPAGTFRPSLFGVLLALLAWPASLVDTGATSLLQHKSTDPNEDPDAGALALKAQTASEAADSAEEAARMAHRVARHSVKITRNTQAALKKARQALHGARVESQGLSENQQDALKEAEARLKEAAKHASGKVQSAEERALHQRLETLKEKLGSQHDKRKSELDQMREELKQMREQLAGTDSEGSMKQSLDEIEKMLKDLEEHGEQSSVSHDELKAEMEHLRELVRKMVEEEKQRKEEEERDAAAEEQKKKDAKEEEEEDTIEEENKDKSNMTKAGPKRPRKDDSSSPIDIDINMPYGNLEPFGREDTAQELTEASIHESNAMVDQIERAEVSEEKRAVFRALTRLRGAAITSYDGVARSQTGNIDQFAKQSNWRETHPLKHLAQEEADVSKWAFPNADF